jgi:hypothetical protein
MEEGKTEMGNSRAEVQETTKPRGNGLRVFQLHNILTELHSNNKTGTLTVKTPVFIKKIYLDKGEVIFASSTWKDDRLGEVLLKAGRLTFGQYEESVRLLKMTGKKQGTILVELGYLTPKDLFQAVKHQVKQIIYSLFPLEYAEYEFIEGEVPQKDILILKIHLGSLIYKGINRIDSFTRIKRELPDCRYPLSISIGTSRLFEGIEFSPLEKSILSLVDGKRSIMELVDHASADARPFEALKSLYVLWFIGILKQNGSTREETETRMTETRKTEKGNNGKMWDLENIMMFSPHNHG